MSSPVTMSSTDLPGEVVPFSKIGEKMLRSSAHDPGATRALVATVVAIGPLDRLTGVAQTLQIVGDAGTVRGILISEGDDPAPPARVMGNTVSLYGIKPPYVNNAVAALRLSSLPTLIWWRGGRPDTLDGLVGLAERIVLDEEQPIAVWRRAATLFEASAFSDMRWARLTQWRALMAHFFDIPEVMAVAPLFTHLRIRAADPLCARLFAAWLTSSLRMADGFEVEVVTDGAMAPLEEVSLTDGGQALTIRLAARACLETSAAVRGHCSASRVVAVTDVTPASLLTGELRIRARDLAFERAVRSLLAAAPGDGHASERR